MKKIILILSTFCFGLSLDAKTKNDMLSYQDRQAFANFSKAISRFSALVKDLQRAATNFKNGTKKFEKVAKESKNTKATSNNTAWVYHIDNRSSVKKIYVSPNQAHASPYKNYFRIISYTPMSNANGNRSALLVLKNHGTRTRLHKGYFIATFGDGSRKLAKSISTDEHVNADAKMMATVFFGYSKFPIVHIDSK